MERISNRVSNIAHFLTKNAARFPEVTAVSQGNRTINWREMDARVSALASGLAQEFGIGKGDAVLVQLANCPAIVEIMLACFRLGAIWVPVNFRQAPGETAYNAAKSKAKAFVTEAKNQAHIAEAQAANPALKHSLTLEIETGRGDYEAFVERHMGNIIENVSVEYNDPCWLFFTSGSTGRPKAVVLTHGQLTFTIVNHSADLMPGTTEQDASLAVAPLSHGAGLQLMVQLATGTPSILMPHGPFDPALAWSLIEQHKVSNLFTVPTIVKMMVEHDSVDRFDHSSLRHVIYAGAPMYRADQKYALEKLGPVLVQYYGLGEVTGAITVQRTQDHYLDDAIARPGTCGTERMGIEVSIQDADGNVMAPGETGEICVTGPAVCAGYLDDDDANAKAFRDGWFRTGDLGHMDEDRFLYITGRASDMYISGGSNVYPREIEEVLLELDGLSEVAILGVPDEKWGEVGLAVCVCETGATLTEDEVRAFLADRISKYKQPARYVFLSEMPKSSYGKITKKLVREHLEAQGLL